MHYRENNEQEMTIKKRKKMKAPSRLAMKMFVSALKNKKGATDKEKEMADKIATSYDISDIKYIEPIVEYLGEK